MEQENIIVEQMLARVKSYPFPRRKLFILLFVILLHIILFVILFGTRSDLINIKVPELTIIQVDIAPDLAQSPVRELDAVKKTPVNPSQVNPKKLEAIKTETEVPPEPIAKEKEFVELTPAPTKNSSPEPIPTAPSSSSLHEADVFNLQSPNHNSGEIDLKAGLDSIVLECLKSLNFTEKAQPCYQPKPDTPQNIPATEICRIEIDVMIDGTVENFTATDCPNPKFLEDTRKAVKDWRYVPAVVNGKKVVERSHGVKVIICESNLENQKTYPDICSPKPLISLDILNKPIELGKPRPLDKGAMEKLESVQEFLAQSRPSQADKQDPVETPPKKKLSLDEILK